MKLSQKTCLWKERIDFFGLRKDMSHAQRGGSWYLYGLMRMIVRRSVGNDLAPAVQLIPPQ